MIIPSSTRGMIKSRRRFARQHGMRGASVRFEERLDGSLAVASITAMVH